MERQFKKYSMFNLVVFLIIILIGQIACQRAERRSDIDNSAMESSSERNIVDSIFQADFAILDAALEQKHTKGYYSLYRVNEVTDFLVSLSGIEPTVDMTYIGWLGVNQEDVLKWKEWYAQNKRRLKCDEEKQEVVMKSDIIYDRNIVDSLFQADFAFLDSTLENKYATEYYPFDRVQEVTIFLVSLSGIQPTVEMSYIGWMGVNQEDVIKWKELYDQNRHKLKWDGKSKR